ncbi:MAG TPA: DUF2336 domain-containing protein [Rhizobiaceae bacterium]|nr:DUF2336 domain-containing protein [Rhizobiaceae bacterium]
MSDTRLSIADEVEAAMVAGPEAKYAETVARVTALFLASAGSYSHEQIELFGDVFERLVNTIELRALADVSARIALAELSSQLAPVPQAPASLMRRLARHDEISIAGPVLSESPRLSNEDLVEIANAKSEKHLIAIAGRWWLQEIVTDALVGRRFPTVSRRLVANPGARVSAAGFAVILSQAVADPELAVATGIRADLPVDLRRQLLRTATDTVKARLLSQAPPHLFEEIRDAVSGAAARTDRELFEDRDAETARMLMARLQKEGRLSEATLRDLATQKRYEETLAALAELAHSSVEIIRPLMQSRRSDGILVPCKVAGLGWETVEAVLDCRFSRGVTARDELSRLKLQFAELATEQAARLLGFWTVRSVAPLSRPSRRN